MGECDTTYRSSYSFNTSFQSPVGATFGRRFSDLATNIAPSFRRTSTKGSLRKNSDSSFGSNFSLNSPVFYGSNASLNSFRGSNRSLSSGNRSRKNSLNFSDQNQYGNTTNSEVRSRRSSVCVSDHKRDGNLTPDIHGGWGLKGTEFQKRQNTLNTQNGSRSKIPVINRSYGNLLSPDIYGSRCSLKSDMSESSESLNFDNSKSHESLNADIRRTRFQQNAMYRKKDNRSNPDLRRYNVGRTRIDSDMTKSNESLHTDINEIYSSVTRKKVLTKQNSVSQTIADILINQSEQKYLGSDKTRKKWREANNKSINPGDKRTTISNVIDQFWNKEDGKYSLQYTGEKSKSHSDIVNEIRSEQLQGQKEKRRESRREEKKLRDLERQKMRSNLNKETKATDNNQIKIKVQADLEKKMKELNMDEDKNKFKTVGKVIKACKIPILNKNKFEVDKNNANKMCTVRVTAKSIQKKGCEDNTASKTTLKNKLKNNVRTVETQMAVCQRLHEGKYKNESKPPVGNCKSQIGGYKSPSTWNNSTGTSTISQQKNSPSIKKAEPGNCDNSNQSSPAFILKRFKSLIDENNSRPNSPIISRMVRRAKVKGKGLEQTCNVDSIPQKHSFEKCNKTETKITISEPSVSLTDVPETKIFFLIMIVSPVTVKMKSVLLEVLKVAFLVMMMTVKNQQHHQLSLQHHQLSLLVKQKQIMRF